MRSARRRALAVSLLLVAGALGACEGSGEPSAPEELALVQVPGDAGTLQEAADKVAPGGVILLGPGTYEESVSLTKPRVTLRGADRNTVVLDGEGKRTNGVVASAPGVVVENLTVTRFLLNGVLVTGVVDADGEGIGRGSSGYEPIDTTKFPPVKGFAVRFVTATNNGLYGIYAFNRNDGVIEHNYASGSADSGIYVGQCRSCNVNVLANVAEFNAVGYENANASGVVVAGNRFARNRVGVSVTSDYQEAYSPQGRLDLVGNVVAGNHERATPSQADGGFGVGVGLAGTTDVRVERNRVVDNPWAGLALAPAEDLPAAGTRAEGNVLAGNRRDVVYWTTARSGGGRPNCVRLAAGATTYPAPLPGLATCGTGGPREITAPPTPVAPAGISFLDVALPPALPTMDLEDPAAPGVTRVEAIDLAAIDVPPPTLLRAQARP